MHLFGHTFDHDYYFELPREGERDTQSITRCFTSHHRLFRAFPRANRTFSTARNPIPCVASSTNVLPVSAPWRPWRSSVLDASSGGNTCSGWGRKGHPRSERKPIVHGVSEVLLTAYV